MDLAVGCTYKYLCAGPGAPGFLYVRQGLADQLRTPIPGWFGHRDQFAMTSGYAPADGVTRFLAGTPPVAGIVAVDSGVEFISGVGIGVLRSASMALTTFLVDLADEWLAPLGFRLASPRDATRRGGHVVLAHPDAYAISAALIQSAGVVADVRPPDLLRLAPVPLVTSFADVREGVRRIRDLVASGLPQRRAARSGHVSDEDLSILSRPGRGPDLVLRYGPHVDHVADVHLPPAHLGVRNTLVMLHGGFWGQAYDRTHLRSYAVHRADAGWAVVTPEYRRVGGDGGWPETFDDVRELARQLPELLGEAAPDTAGKPIVLSGHSAGGHLALWLAAAEPPAGLASVLALAPVANLRAAHEDRLGGDAALALMGVPPEVDPPRWLAADPTRLPAPAVPVTIFHGRRDTVVPVGQSYGYRVRHPGTRLVVFDCAHFELIDPDARVGDGEPVLDP